MEARAFDVFAPPELHEYNRLKCWVCLNLHWYNKDWPNGYQPWTSLAALEYHGKREENDEQSVITVDS